MRTSLNEIKQIEAYLCNELSTGERLLFEARMITSKSLRQNVSLQRAAYALIQHYHREVLKQQFEELHAQLFNDPERTQTKEAVINLFNP